MTEKKIELSDRLNMLRAAVLGANDGIIGAAGVILGVSGAPVSGGMVLVAGVAELLAVALSMSSGEYVSVSSQKDAELAVVNRIKADTGVIDDTDYDLVAGYFTAKGVPNDLARQAASEVLTTNPVNGIARLGYQLTPDELLSPGQAALSSFVASVGGGIWPLLAVVFAPGELKVVLTIAATLFALWATGFLSAKLGHSPVGPAVWRNLVAGVLTMVVTYLVGMLFR
jgi:VIT1/CCC1 family predicted Fe2+/Mn2+ transporter